MDTALRRKTQEYADLWHGGCTEAVAARMAALEAEIADMAPATVEDAKRQAVVALAASGSLEAGPLLPAALAVAV